MRAIQYLDVLFGFVPVAVGWSRREFLDRPLRWYLLRLAFVCAAEVVSLTLSKLWIPNAPFVQLSHVVDTLLLVVLFRMLLGDLPYSGLIPWIFPAYLAAFVAAKFTIEPLTLPDQYTYTAVCLVLLALSIVVLLRSLAAEGAGPASNPWTWISLGMIVWFASNLVLFSVLYWYVTLSYDEAVRIYSFHWAGNIVINGIVTWGLLRVRTA